MKAMESKMKVVAVIPMKLNNSRLAQKNTKSFTNGKPLCSYILETIKKVKSVDEIYVYCSNSEIKNYMPEGIKYLSRPESLDTDSATMNDVLNNFIVEVDADVYLLTHATAPFIKAESIENGIDAIIKKGYDSAFSAKKLQEFMWYENKPINYNPENIPRTQDLSPYYVETCGFYAFKKELITKYNRRIGANPYMVEVSEIESVDINVMSDFIIADAIYNHIIKEGV